MILVLSLALLPTSARAERRVAVYKVGHRAAAELLPVAEAAMAGSGTVALDRATNSLVVIGESAVVADALELLATQDRRLRTVVLRYDTKRSRDLANRGFDVHWTARAGDFRIGSVRRPPAADSGASVDVRVDDAMRALEDSFTGTIRVLEGGRTRIETGTSVPFTTSGRHGPSTQQLTAETGFDASPRILRDGRVQVDLAAFAGRLGHGATIETTTASSLLVLTPGETVAVAGIQRSSDDRRRNTLRGAGSASDRDDTLLLLRADVE